MKTATKVSQLVRLGSGALLLVLGLIVWTGHGDQLIGIHTMLGFLLVLPLWAIAAIAVRSGVAIGLEVGRDREGGTGFRVGPGHSCRSPAARSLSLAGQTGRALDLKGPKTKGFT